MKGIEFQIVEKFKLTDKKCSEIRLIKGLSSERMRQSVEPIRELVADGRQEEANKLKMTLPAIIVSGIFKGGRTSEYLLGHTGVLCLDLDKLHAGEVQELKAKIINDTHTFIAFISPSGLGLKVFVKVEIDKQHHTTAYKQVMTYYSKLTGKRFDANTFDPTRLTFMSYDPEPYHYPDSDLFPVDIPKSSLSIVSDIEANNCEYKAIYDRAFKDAERRKGRYEVGNRNNVLSLTAYFCCLNGLPKEELMKYIEWSDLPEYEKHQLVSSAYKRPELFGTKKLNDFQNAVSNVIDVKQKCPDATPLIPDDIKLRFPAFINEFISRYSDSRQNDMAFTAFITLLSSLMFNTVCAFRDDEHYPALASVITAPSGSGKSVMGHIQKLFLPVHEKLVREGCLKHGLFLADNSSNTSLTKALSDNNGIGMLFSSDMGFFGLSMKRDLPGLQAIFRTTQSEEIIRNGRSAKRGIISIPHPRLAICLSSLPQEFRTLFNSQNDGLTSRFIHYTFMPTQNWIPLVENTLKAHRSRQHQAHEKISELYEYLKSKQFEFVFRPEQLLAINSWHEDKLESVDRNHSAVTDPIIKRVQLSILKLSMILAVLRAWEANSQSGTLFLEADDFDAVMKLAGVYLAHGLTIATMNFSESSNGLDPRLMKFFEALPDTFKRKEALDVAKSTGFNVSDRTLDSFLKKLVELKYLDKSYSAYNKRPEKRDFRSAA